jgi:hypothetical protein
MRIAAMIARHRMNGRLKRLEAKQPSQEDRMQPLLAKFLELLSDAQLDLFCETFCQDPPFDETKAHQFLQGLDEPQIAAWNAMEAEA